MKIAATLIRQYNKHLVYAEYFTPVNLAIIIPMYI